jgi:thioredoxin 1
MALEITDSNFEELVIKSGKPAMLDFWAVWCPPCIKVGPIVDQMAVDYDGKAVIGKVDADNNAAITVKYGVRNLPTMLFFNEKGEVVDRLVGLTSKQEYEKKLMPLLAAQTQ